MASCALTLCTWAAQISAQDSHYWSEQYGTRATLLGGSMIGSARDLSATYYNPGAIALDTEELGFILSARAYRNGTLIFEDGGGEALDLASSSQRPIPTLLAGSLRFDWLGKHRIAYSMLTRQQFDGSVRMHVIDERDVFIAPGDESVTGAFVGSIKMRESWAGLSWAYPLGEHVGIGLTQFLATRDHELGSQLLAQVGTQADEVSTAIRIRHRDFRSYRTMTKMGVAWESGAVSLGINATTPSLHLSGSGGVTYNASLSGVDQTGDGSADNYLASDVQGDLSATYRTSWIVGAGGALRVADFRFHWSAEWFDSVDRYTVIDAADVIPQVGPGVVVNDLTGEFDSVLNWGLGVEYGVDRSVTAYAGIAADKSAASPEAPFQTDPVITKYDLLRITGGVSFTIKATELMLGLGWAGGVTDFPRLVDLDNLGTDRDVFAGTEGSALRLKQWTFVLGFELGR